MSGGFDFSVERLFISGGGNFDWIGVFEINL